MIIDVVIHISHSYLVIYSLRLLLHQRTASENNKLVQHSQTLEHEELSAAQAFVEGLLEESLAKLQEEEVEKHIFVRWELGACWIQHLQDQNNIEKDKKPSTAKTKNEMKVEGLGTPLRSLKNNKKNLDGNNLKMQYEKSKTPAESVIGEAENSTLSSTKPQLEANANENELALKRMLSDAAFARLKQSETGLHRKVIFCQYHWRYKLLLCSVSCTYPPMSLTVFTGTS